MDEKRQMKAREIDDEGYWQHDGIEIQLLGCLLPIPVEVRFYPNRTKKRFYSSPMQNNISRNAQGQGVMLLCRESYCSRNSPECSQLIVVTGYCGLL